MIFLFVVVVVLFLIYFHCHGQHTIFLFLFDFVSSPTVLLPFPNPEDIVSAVTSDNSRFTAHRFPNIVLSQQAFVAYH